MTSENGVPGNNEFALFSQRESTDEQSTTREDYQKMLAGLEEVASPEIRHIFVADLLASKDEVINRQRRELKEAYLDGVTGLRTRKVFDEVHESLFGLGEPYGLLIVDLDDLKQVNDTYGHSAGDEVLNELAGRLLANVRQEKHPPHTRSGDRRLRNDVFKDPVGRIGGDELGVLFPGMASEVTLLDRAAAITHDVRMTPFNVTLDNETVPLNMTISVGGAIRTRDMQSRAQLQKIADDRLYSSKKYGKDRPTILLPLGIPPSTKRA